MDLEAASLHLQKTTSPAAGGWLVLIHVTLSRDHGNGGQGKKGRERELMADGGRAGRRGQHEQRGGQKRVERERQEACPWASTHRARITWPTVLHLPPPPPVQVMPVSALVLGTVLHPPLESQFSRQRLLCPVLCDTEYTLNEPALS